MYGSGMKKPGRLLQLWREEAGITQADMGKRLGGLTRSYMSLLENGRSAPSIQTAIRIQAMTKGAIPVTVWR